MSQNLEKSDMVTIDGSKYEGGGQILRNSVSYSALMGKPLRIQNVRQKMKPPGLANQHRTGIVLAATITSGRVDGAKNGSSVVEFSPGKIALPGHFTADAVTAGATSLLVQIALPILLFSATKVPESTLCLLGGTNAERAPQIDYIKHVFLPFVRRHLGVKGVELDVLRRGYYPKGGGDVRLRVTPLHGDARLKSFSLLERGVVVRIGGVAHFAKLPRVVGTQMVESALRKLRDAGYLSTNELEEEGCTGASDGRSQHRIPIDIVPENNAETWGAGSGIVLWAELEGGGIIGGSAVGRKSRSPEDVGAEAAEELIKGFDEGGCVDGWLQDQIIIFMVLADGQSELRCGTRSLTSHTRTAIWVAEQMTGAKFDIENEESGHTIIRCQGVGYRSPISMK